jgi:hypothetical protein
MRSTSLVGPRHEEGNVHAQRRHTGKAIVLQHQDRPGERVVESARHDVALGNAALVHVHTRDSAHVIGDGDCRALLDLTHIHHGHGCRGIASTFSGRRDAVVTTGLSSVATSFMVTSTVTLPPEVTCHPFGANWNW